MQTIVKCTLLILWTCCLTVIGANGVGLPEIWKHIRADKSYHILFKLKMRDATEQITLEEWASFEKHLFRLDLIYGTSRITYLTIGETSEIFRYSAFKCELLEPDSKDLGVIGNLFKGYGLMRPPSEARAYGMGPLWLRAMADATNDKLLSTKTSDNKKHKFLHNFVGYQVSFKAQPDEIPYNLRFYFKQDYQTFIDAVEWLDPVETNQSKNKEPKVEARATVIWVELDELAESVFELPVGYGCFRKPNQERAPGNSVSLLHQGGPNQAVLELTMSKPTGNLLHNWDSRTYTARMLRGQLKLDGSKRNSYYVTQIQERDPTTSRMHRTKRVWSFPSKTNEAVVYSIDIESKKCQVSHESVEDSIRLVFPGQQNELAPMALTLDAIENMFNSNEDYHFIRESKSSNSSRTTDTYFEKRINNYQIKSNNRPGSFVFDGPVSIVKKLSYLSLLISNAKKTNSSYQANHFSYHTKFILFFYSTDLSEILYKATIDLIDQDEVDIRFMHKELDVSQCFAEEQKLDVVIKYPLESIQFGKQLSVIQDLVEEYFCLNLFKTTPIQPVQVTNINLNYDNFFIYFKMTLIDLPLTHFFKIQRGVKLSRESGKTGVLEKVTPNAERCASACELYHCLRFSFESDNLRCALQVDPNVEALQHSEFSETYVMESSWDKFLSDGYRSHLRPEQIVELLNELMTNEADDNGHSQSAASSSTADQDDVPLTLVIESYVLPNYKIGDPPDIRLRPSSIESDVETMYEMAKFATRALESDANGTVLLHLNGEYSHFQVEYSLLFEQRQYLISKLTSSPGARQTEAFSYEDCAHACEDNNCKSFSYCPSDGSCSLTNLHETTVIEGMVGHHSDCNVFILDYLSKFEYLGFVAAPVEVQKIIRQVPLSDCALHCMEESGFNCQGFYHSSEGEIKCLLISRHVELFDKGLSFSLTKSVDKQSFRFYSRSNLAQFNQFIGKVLKAPESEIQDEMETIEGFGAEFCAQTCIEQSCLAFHVCLEPDESGGKLKQVCQFARKEVRKSHLIARKRCTTFVLSDKSQFNRQGIKILKSNEKPDLTALDKPTGDVEIVLDFEKKEAIKGDINEQLLDLISARIRQESILDSSHWLAKLFTVFLGTLMGIGCVSLWRRKERIRDLASALSAGLGRK